MEATPPPAVEPEIKRMAQAVLSLYYHCELSSGRVKAPHFEDENGEPISGAEVPSEYGILSFEKAIEKLQKGNPPLELITFAIMVLARSVKEVGASDQDVMGLLEKWGAQRKAADQERRIESRETIDVAALYRKIFQTEDSNEGASPFERAYKLLTNKSLGTYNIRKEYVQLGRHE